MGSQPSRPFEFWLRLVGLRCSGPCSELWQAPPLLRDNMGWVSKAKRGWGRVQDKLGGGRDHAQLSRPTAPITPSPT